MQNYFIPFIPENFSKASFKKVKIYQKSIRNQEKVDGSKIKVVVIEEIKESIEKRRILEEFKAIKMDKRFRLVIESIKKIKDS